MDNASDDTITFNEKGECSYCTHALNVLNTYYYPFIKDDSKVKRVIEKVKNESTNQKYDCMMGISGGLDSSYVAYLGTVKYGLRVLAFHVDDGFDTEISKRNIKRLGELPNLDLKMITPDAKQFCELTRAFLKAGVPNIAMPQDNVLFAELYKAALKYKIKYFFTGVNYSLESILQKGNTHPNDDSVNIKDIFNRFGRGRIDKLSFISKFKKDCYRLFNGIENINLLDMVDYKRENAIKELHDGIGFEYYGSKHLENDLTKFIQLYWFPKKFNVDKRKSHLSSMIVSGQLTRDEALEMMKQPMYNEEDMKATIQDILERLDLTEAEFKNIMDAPSHQHTDYKTSSYPRVKQAIKNVLGRK